MDVDVNWVAILLAAAANMALGFVWYSKALFADQWMKLSGVTAQKIEAAKDKMPMTYGLMFLASVVEAYVLSHFLVYAGASSLTDGAVGGLWVWIGFVATVMLTGVLFEGRPIKLYYITAGYQLVSFVMMGAIIAAMG